MDRSRKMLVGGVAAVVVIVLVVIVAWPRYIQHNVATCAPSADKPDVKAIKVENLASSDAAVLANLAGYVELVGEKSNSYLPLDVSAVKSETKNGATTVTLSGDCVTVDVVYEVSDDTKNSTANKSYSYSSINMELRKENAKEAESVCEFSKPFVFKQPIDERYSCQKEQSHECTAKVDKKVTPVANLVLKSFEMELERAKDAKKDEFVKKAWDSSCSVWDK